MDVGKRIAGDVNEKMVNHPPHYSSGKIEVIEAIEDWGLGFNLGNAVKYIARMGKKNGANPFEDLHKAVWYINREVELMQSRARGCDPRRPNDMNPREERKDVPPASVL